MRIEEQHVVSIEYQLFDIDRGVMDQSPAGQPLQYLHGSHGVLPALEAALEGKVVGDSFDVVIPPSAAFGERREDVVVNVPRSEFPADADLQVGTFIMKANQDSGAGEAMIIAIEEDHLTIDGNHPLAGRTLRFVGRIVDVREALPEELEPGKG